MDQVIREVMPKNMAKIRIDVEEFITLFNEKKIEVIDIRIPKETAIWQMNFGLKIPAHELPDHLDTLPRDKELIIVCPYTDRSNMARFYLASKGFKVRYLYPGLMALMDRLKGGLSNDLILS
ncbi:rhodanese-like domain-containing protein [Sulfurospirillum sp. 1612]|uniref:rhodanese-like domain-containing protein n=1 Tax=Sulfurospirillum sp. 1612 TaxID=3094835 RepID=UPI002F94923F